MLSLSTAPPSSRPSLCPYTTLFRSRIRCEWVPACGERGFTIVASGTTGERATSVSPDVATCADCLREMFDPNDRRWHYAFTKDRKSTRLNSSHLGISYAVFCLKKKK